MVFEQHAALFCKGTGGKQVGVGFGFGRFALCAAISERIFKQPKAGLYGENAAHRLVQGLLAYLALFHCFFQKLVVAAALHIHIVAGVQGLDAGFLKVLGCAVVDHLHNAGVVAHHKTVKAPLVSQYLCE